MKAIVLSFVATIALTGCVSSTYVTRRDPDPADAKVYLIRQSAQPYAWNLYVFLDRQKVASISNHSYVTFAFPAGEHALHAEWPRMAGNVRVDGTMTLKPGATYYFVITGSVGIDAPHGHWRTTLEIAQTSQPDGEALLKKLAD
jgi:hypothetical protein